MICEKCGKEYDDSANLCPYCGTANSAHEGVADVEKKEENIQKDMAADQTSEIHNGRTDIHAKADKTAQKIPRNIKMIISIAVTVVAVIIIAFVVNKNRPIVINATDYLTVTFDGYEGIGTADVEIDEDKLEQYLTKGLERTGQIDKNRKLLSEDTLMSFLTYDGVSSAFDVKTDKQDNLSNGDKITCTITTNSLANELKDYKIRIKTGKKTFKVTGLKKAETFDAFKDVNVSFKGANGYGNTEITGGTDGLIYQADKESNLSNGDKINVTISTDWDTDFDDYARDYGKIPKTTTKEYTVSGLSEIKEIDAFSDDMVSVTFSGTSGDGQINIEPKKADQYNMNYSADHSYALSNGDKITVTVANGYGLFDDDYVAEYGVKPKETTKTYTVEGLQEYVSSFSQISEADLGQFKKAVENDIKTMDAENDKYSINSLTYLGYYFMTPKQGQENNASDKNWLILVYAQNATDTAGAAYAGSDYHPGQAFDGIVAAGLSNLLIDSSGKVTADQSDIVVVPKDYYFEFTADRGVVAYDNTQAFYNAEITPMLDTYSADTNIQL